MSVARTPWWRRALLAAAALAVCSVAGAAPEPGVLLVHGPDGAPARLTALSSDGRKAAGYAFFDRFSAARLRAFVWTTENGRSDLVGNPLPYQSEAKAIDDSGEFIAGTHVSVRNAPYQAFRRRINDGENELLPLVPAYNRSIGNDISGDGRAVVGYCERGPNTYWDAQAFIWREGVGTVPLGFARPGSIISDARAISRDGSTVVGVSIDGSLTSEAFTWTESGGMRVLNSLPDARYRDTIACAVSADGRVTVGAGSISTGRSVALMWREGSPDAILLGTIGQANGIFPTGLSDDGSIAVGYADLNSSYLPFIWTESTGMISLDSYLNQYGVTVPDGWTLSKCFAVSGDGLTFAGEATTSSGLISGFVATIPAPGSVVVLGVLAVVRRRRSRGSER